MNGKHCTACGRGLEGRQLKYCSDEVCAADRRYWAWVLKVYNLTREQYEAIVQQQGGKCPITGRPLEGPRRPHIDHDHGTGVVRGVVTAYANTRLIGRLRDWTTAQRLADYLRDPPATKALGAPVVAAGRPKAKRKKKRR